MTPLEHDLAALHKPLLRFAKLQLRDEAAAEDAVSATPLSNQALLSSYSTA